MAKPGNRFADMKAKLAEQKGGGKSGALAAYIGRPVPKKGKK